MTLTNLIGRLSVLFSTPHVPEQRCARDQPVPDLACNAETGAATAYSHATSLLWLDILAICALLVGLASLF